MRQRQAWRRGGRKASCLLALVLPAIMPGIGAAVEPAKSTSPDARPTIVLKVRQQYEGAVVPSVPEIAAVCRSVLEAAGDSVVLASPPDAGALVIEVRGVSHWNRDRMGTIDAGADVTVDVSGTLEGKPQVAHFQGKASPERYYGDVPWQALFCKAFGRSGFAPRFAAMVSESKGIPALAPLLAALAIPDDTGAVQESCVAPLAKFGSQAVDPLVRMLAHDDPSVRHSAADALGAIGAPALGPLLAVAKGVEKSPRIAALRGLGWIHDPRAVDALLGSLKDEDEDVVVTAVWALAVAADTRALPALTALLKEPRSFARAEAAAAMSGMGPAAVSPLAEALADEDKFVRIEAARGLGKIGDMGAIKPLTAALDDKDLSVRVHAVESLGSLACADSARALVKAAHQRSLWLDAGESLKRIAPAAVPVLIETLSSPDGDDRRFAASLLGDIKPPEAVGPLVKALASDDGMLALYAQLSLQGMGSMAVAPLIEALADPKFAARDRAAYLLGRSGDKRAEEPLRKASLRDPSLGVRIAASQALGNLKATVPQNANRP